jgi:hypothetical protein
VRILVLGGTRSLGHKVGQTFSSRFETRGSTCIVPREYQVDNVVSSAVKIVLGYQGFHTGAGVRTRVADVPTERAESM